MTTVKVDADNLALFESRKWFLTSHGYVQSRHQYLHRLIMGVEDKRLQVDHINGDKLDNRRVNLRVVTHQENIQNRVRLNINNTSGVRGVLFDGRYKRPWRARAKLLYVHVEIGRYDTIEEATEAVRLWRLEHMSGALD